MKSRLLFLGLAVLLLGGCASNHKKEQTTTKEQGVLVGWINPEELLNTFPAYKKGYQDYHPDSLALAKIKAVKEHLQVLVFIGTWCPDSRREVPRFLKTVHLAANPNIKVKIYGLDRTKKDKAGLTEKYNVQFVPTFIFLVKDNEIGRIVEFPETSIEQDFVKIIGNK